jgi:hypothetical protein
LSEYSNGILNLFYLFAGPKIVTDDEMILDVSGRFGKLTRRMAPTGKVEVYQLGFHLLDDNEKMVEPPNQRRLPRDFSDGLLLMKLTCRNSNRRFFREEFRRVNFTDLLNGSCVSPMNFPERLYQTSQGSFG